MRAQQKGFTLIELIIVIVILGALAVVALPRFLDLQEDAQQAAVEGVAGNISSAFAINYADSLVGDDTDVVGVTADDDITINNGALEVDGTPGLITTSDLGDYTINGCSVDEGAETGTSGSCDIERSDDATISASFTWVATE